MTVFLAVVNPSWIETSLSVGLIGAVLCGLKRAVVDGISACCIAD
jgi:hypothetical protein